MEEIGDYIARDGPEASIRTITEIFHQAEKLGAHPHLGRAGRAAGTRELVVRGTPFLVIYRVRDVEVEILAVFHGARKWPERFD